jgi:hypothetical protein
MASKRGLLKIQSQNNGSPLQWRRSHAMSADLASHTGSARPAVRTQQGRLPTFTRKSSAVPRLQVGLARAAHEHKSIFGQDLEQAQFVSFNFVYPLICTVASSVRTAARRPLTRACHRDEPK